MLNARGHRRGGHGFTPGANNLVAACSTPVGIEEAGIRAHAGFSTLRKTVLNARGHRRGGHSSKCSRQTNPGEFECSTPVGIEEAGMR